MNSVLIKVVHENESQNDSSKAILEALFNQKYYSIEGKSVDSLGWKTIKAHHQSFSYDKYLPYDTWFTFVSNSKMFRLSNETKEKLKKNYPLNYPSNEQIEEYEKLVMKCENPDLFWFLGNSKFNITSQVLKYIVNGAHSGYKVKAKSWNLISWNSIMHYSSINRDHLIIVRQEMDMSHGNVDIERGTNEFIVETPEAYGEFLQKNPDTNEVSWFYQNKPLDIDRCSITGYSPTIVIKTTCLNGAMISMNMEIVMNKNSGSRRHEIRQAENPWNALREHVEYADDGSPILRQPEGAGPNRAQNYSENNRTNADNGGSAPHPSAVG